jgi:hypothetical protein
MRAMVRPQPERNVGPDGFRRRFASAIKSVLAVSLLFITSCGGSLFKVKPPAALQPMPATVASANLGSISFRAAPLLTDEETQELFESNLQLAGLLPIRVEIDHNGGDPIELKKLRFHLTDAAGTKWKSISTKQAIARILKANDVFAYNPASRKLFEAEFRAYELNLKGPLTHDERRRQGFLIFLAPEKTPVSSPRGLKLTIEGLSQPATLNLN